MPSPVIEEEGAIALKALQESEARYRELVDLANAIILRWDSSGRITFFNEFAQDFFGFSAEEIIGQHVVGTIVPETESTGRDLRPLMDDICKHPEDYRHNVNEDITKSGKRVWVAWSNRVIQDDMGIAIGALSVGSDVTRERELEEELRQGFKMRAIGELAGGIAHDFNNMLHAMQGFSEAIVQQSENPKVLASAAQIIQITRDAAELTSNLLTFARKGQSESKYYDAGKIIEELRHILDHTLDKRIHCDIGLPTNSCQLYGDPAQFKSALLNLAINSQDAINGEGLIRIECVDCVLDRELTIADFTLPAGSYLHMRFKDNGIGISASDVQHIFEPFFSTKESGRGVGLGLSAVYGTVHMHQGAIKCTSKHYIEHGESGSGTCFDIYLPTYDSAEETVASSAIATTPAPSINILVIDDEDIVLNFSQAVFAEAGHRVATFSDPQRAIDHYAAHMSDVDMVLLDMNMPIMSGEQVFYALKALNPKVKVVLSSGYGYEGSMDKMLKDGLAGFQQKPYSLKNLEQTILKLYE